MLKKLILALCFLSLISCDLSKYRLVKDWDLETPFEKSNGNQTPTYQEVIDFYTELDDATHSITMEEYGETDSGKPLHVVFYNPDGGSIDFETNTKQVLFINNGIHPGESDGIDATMLLMRDLALDSLPLPKNTVLATIPIYNVGGSLNRNSTSRANQNGPEEYGFRGNARNFDLNRDFIKADTKNTRTFYEIFHMLNPAVFIDNHVSNGADYQYTLTHLLTQHDKLEGQLGNYLHTDFLPKLIDSLKAKNQPITPYVNVFNKSPKEGFSQFLDQARYSTGYTTLFNTLGMMVETHMLKPYDQRVKATYDFMLTTLKFVDAEAEKIEEIRNNNIEFFKNKKEFYLNYQVDSTKTSSYVFKGYQDTLVKSEVTGLEQLKYNRNKPYSDSITYYNYFEPKDTLPVPKAYIIPKGWWPVVERLKWNNIKMIPLEKDTLIKVEAYRIEDYQTVSQAYEGHYLHYNTKVEKYQDSIQFQKGDLYVKTNQIGIRYLMETLEPSANDSFFNWNFFDTVLQQKEHFSPYVFEEEALQFLNENPEIKRKFDSIKEANKEFSKNGYEQLNWIYKKTDHYEKTHLRYPIFRVAN